MAHRLIGCAGHHSVSQPAFSATSRSVFLIVRVLYKVVRVTLHFPFLLHNRLLDVELLQHDLLDVSDARSRLPKQLQ